MSSSEPWASKPAPNGVACHTAAGQADQSTLAGAGTTASTRRVSSRASSMRASSGCFMVVSSVLQQRQHCTDFG